jgi:hypothetical protein
LKIIGAIVLWTTTLTEKVTMNLRIAKQKAASAKIRKLKTSKNLSNADGHEWNLLRRIQINQSDRSVKK